MKRYIRSNSAITTYQGFDIGMEDSGNQRYYFQYAPGKFQYANTIDELKSKIDKIRKKKSSAISQYHGYNIEIEDDENQQFYVELAPGEIYYADTINEIKSKIDKLGSPDNANLHRYQVLYLTTLDTTQYTVVEAKDKPSAKQIAKKKIGRDFTRCVGINEI